MPAPNARKLSLTWADPRRQSSRRMRRTVVCSVVLVLALLAAGTDRADAGHQGVQLPGVAPLSVQSEKCMNEVRWMEYIVPHACVFTCRLLGGRRDCALHRTPPQLSMHLWGYGPLCAGSCECRLDADHTVGCAQGPAGTCLLYEAPAVALPTPWQCIWVQRGPISGSAPWVPVRRNAAHDIECLTIDSRHCMWVGDEATCKAHAASNYHTKLLACGADHQRKYGYPGYRTPTHWCAIANALVADQVATLSSPNQGNHIFLVHAPNCTDRACVYMCGAATFCHAGCALWRAQHWCLEPMQPAAAARQAMTSIALHGCGCQHSQDQVLLCVVETHSMVRALQNEHVVPAHSSYNAGLHTA
jgi:hypothetical protein